ncbi:hypothetical protein MTO96_023830 [Rhipicephalus appendiculatus]
MGAKPRDARRESTEERESRKNSRVLADEAEAEAKNILVAMMLCRRAASRHTPRLTSSRRALAVGRRPPTQQHGDENVLCLGSGLGNKNPRVFRDSHSIVTVRVWRREA